jgi:RNA polymerase sigma factor (sigma-70 family)
MRLQNADDVAAWDEFAELYRPIVFRVARKREFQAADAENLVQEVLLAVAQSVSKWIERDDRGSFRAWLLRIAHNEAVDMLEGQADAVSALAEPRTCVASRQATAFQYGLGEAVFLRVASDRIASAP